MGCFKQNGGTNIPEILIFTNFKTNVTINLIKLFKIEEIAYVINWVRKVTSILGIKKSWKLIEMVVSMSKREGKEWYNNDGFGLLPLELFN